MGLQCADTGLKTCTDSRLPAALDNSGGDQPGPDFLPHYQSGCPERGDPKDQGRRAPCAGPGSEPPSPRAEASGAAVALTPSTFSLYTNTGFPEARVKVDWAGRRETEAEAGRRQAPGSRKNSAGGDSGFTDGSGTPGAPAAVQSRGATLSPAWGLLPPAPTPGGRWAGSGPRLSLAAPTPSGVPADGRSPPHFGGGRRERRESLLRRAGPGLRARPSPLRPAREAARVSRERRRQVSREERSAPIGCGG